MCNARAPSSTHRLRSCRAAGAVADVDPAPPPGSRATSARTARDTVSVNEGNYLQGQTRGRLSGRPLT